VGIPVGHYRVKAEQFPHIVFQELSTAYDFASGRAWREITEVLVEHFTQEPFCETLEKLKLALLRNKINFTTTTVWHQEGEIIQTSFNFAITRKMESELDD